MRTVGSAIPQLLRDLGTDTVFGIPGVQTLEFFRGIRDAGLRYVLTRSEQGAVFAADGYARTTGRPGVALLISGPGLTNAATAVAQAYHDSVPLLIVSAATPRALLGRGFGALHELPDQQALMRSLTAWSRHVEDPAELPALLASAFASFETGRPRPVHVQVPVDVLAAPAGEWRAERPTTTTPLPPPDAIARAADLLAAASSPVVIAGGGAAGASEPLRRVAERLGAPVALTMNGKGALPDGHPLSLSTTLPCASTLEAIAAADAVLAVGTEFSEVDAYYAPDGIRIGGRLIRLDIDAGQVEAQFEPAVALVGDSGATLTALAHGLAERGVQPRADGSERASTIRAAADWWPRARPLLPLVDAVGEGLPRDAIVASDSTQLGYIGQHVWPAERPRSWMVPAGWGTLGYALPMAIGAAVAAPERPTVCVAGDGGLLFTIGEMATAADLGRPLALLLWNNDGYGEMRDEFAEAGIEPLGTEAAAHDYLRIAEGFGWSAERPRDLAAVPGSIVAALERERPTLIELTPELL